MLPKERRLRKKADFDKVFKLGRVLKRPPLRIVWMVGEGRAGIVVARTVGSNAYRNIVRRRWREALGEIALPNGIDLVIVIREGGAKERGEELRESLREGLTHLS